MNLAEVIAPSVAALPGRTALIVGERPISYREVGDAVVRAAAALVARGAGPGDRIALADACGLPAVAAVLGAARIGAAAAPMSPALTAPEMETLLRVAGAGPVAVAGEEGAGALGAALGRVPLGERELLEPTPEAPPSAGSDDDVAVLVFTSGTTGVPKAVSMTHRVLSDRVRSFASPADTAAGPEVTLMCVPFQHVAGLVGVLVGLASGSTSVVQRRFDAGAWLGLVERHRVSRAFVVPAMLRRILDHPDLGRTDLTSLAMLTYGAAPAAPELVARAVDALPHVALINVFGQTETLGAVTALGPEEHRAGKHGSVGRPLPGVRTRIVDPASGADVPEGQTGELWVEAPHTAQPGWVRTGDLMRRDADGSLYPRGRLSEVINRGGEKIAPAEVEEALRAHPAVVDAAVAGVPDPEMGERVAAAVVASGSLDEASLRGWCRARLAPYKVPERIAFVDALPTTELGKVSRRALLSLLAPPPA